MKKTLLILMCLVTVIAMVSCSSKPKTTPDGRNVAAGVPQFVRDAIRTAPEDVLIGVGTANSATLSASRTNATVRARAEISRQMNSMVQDMIVDFTAGSEVDHNAVVSFQQNITTALSRSTLAGSAIVDEDQDQNGNYWVVVMMSKSAVVNEINQAQAAARLAVPQMQAFNAMNMMDQMFEKEASKEIGFRFD